MPSPASEPYEPRWLALISKLDVHRLVDRFISQLREVPGYNPGPLPAAEVARSARVTIETLIAQMRGAHPGTGDSSAADLGTARARAGVPIASLMSAIRLDFTVIWEHLVQVATDADASLIVRYTSTIVDVVDSYAMQVQRAYVAELHRLQSEATSVKQRYIAELFQDTPPSSERLTLIAESLSVPTDCGLDVIAAVGENIDEVQIFLAGVARKGLLIHTHHLDNSLISFFRLDQLSEFHRKDMVQGFNGLRIGMVVAHHGLAEVRTAAITARELAHLHEDDWHGSVTWSEGWARVARQALHTQGHAIVEDVNGVLEHCSSSERERMLAAVASFLRTGSIGACAAELSCHRNTVTNRLRRFAELTGVDPLVPSQAARLVVGWG